MSAGIPPEYSDAYERAYRHSLAEHPTEFMPAARPGKRASRAETRVAVWAARAEDALVDVFVHTRRRRIAGGVVTFALLLVAYGAGRLLS